MADGLFANAVIRRLTLGSDINDATLRGAAAFLRTVPAAVIGTVGAGIGAAGPEGWSTEIIDRLSHNRTQRSRHPAQL